MTKLQAIREFMTFVLGEKTTIARDKFSVNNFAMDIMNKTPRVKLPENLNCKPDLSDKLFRDNFVSNCPLARGFSNITLTLLHECGHWMTRSNLNIIEYDKMRDKAYTMQMYMAIPWEMLATQWAICWLYDPCNRKVAKEFEKKYFNY